MNRFSSKINCGKFSDGPSRGVLNWELLNREMHWGVLLLIGGGYAMADGSDASGMYFKNMATLYILSPTQVHLKNGC